MITSSWRKWLRRVTEAARRFWSGRGASAVLESVCGICCTVVIVGGVFEVANRLFVDDLLGRAAHAVARDNAVQASAAGSETQLIKRAWEAIRAEVGDRFHPDFVRVEIDVYDDPSAMLRGEKSEGRNGRLGGDAGDMVVVRLRFEPRTPLAKVRRQLAAEESGEPPVRAVAVARNERILELPQPAHEAVEVASVQ